MNLDVSEYLWVTLTAARHQHKQRDLRHCEDLSKNKNLGEKKLRGRLRNISWYLLTVWTWINHTKPMMENSLVKLLNMDWIKQKTYCKSCSGRRTRDKHTFPSLTFEVNLSASPIDSLSKSKMKINSIFKYRDSWHLQLPYKPMYDSPLQLFTTITFLSIY